MIETKKSNPGMAIPSNFEQHKLWLGFYSQYRNLKVVMLDPSKEDIPKLKKLLLFQVKKQFLVFPLVIFLFLAKKAKRMTVKKK